MTYVDPYAGIPACADPEQAAYVAALPNGGPYKRVLSPPGGQNWFMKLLSPPKGQTWLKTADGLKYWLAPAPYRPNWHYLATEDPNVSMHKFTLPQANGPTYLFCYPGGRIGFFSQELGDPNYPHYEAEGYMRDDGANYVYPITGLGTPAHFIDYFPELKLPKPLGSQSEYLTGLRWEEFNSGQFDKFPSKSLQDAAIKILPELFVGFRGRIADLSEPSRRSAVQMVFHQDVWSRLMEGNFLEKTEST